MKNLLKDTVRLRKLQRLIIRPFHMYQQHQIPMPGKLENPNYRVIV